MTTSGTSAIQQVFSAVEEGRPLQPKAWEAVNPIAPDTVQIKTVAEQIQELSRQQKKSQEESAKIAIELAKLTDKLSALQHENGGALTKTAKSEEQESLNVTPVVEEPAKRQVSKMQYTKDVTVWINGSKTLLTEVYPESELQEMYRFVNCWTNQVMPVLWSRIGERLDIPSAELSDFQLSLLCLIKHKYATSTFSFIDLFHLMEGISVNTLQEKLAYLRDKLHLLEFVSVPGESGRHYELSASFFAMFITAEHQARWEKRMVARAQRNTVTK